VKAVAHEHESLEQQACIVSQGRRFSPRQERCLRDITRTDVFQMLGKNPPDKHLKAPCVGIENARISPYCVATTKASVRTGSNRPPSDSRTAKITTILQCHCACHRNAVASVARSMPVDGGEQAAATSTTLQSSPRDSAECSCRCHERLSLRAEQLADTLSSAWMTPPKGEAQAESSQVQEQGQISQESPSQPSIQVEPVVVAHIRPSDACKAGATALTAAAARLRAALTSIVPEVVAQVENAEVSDAVKQPEAVEQGANSSGNRHEPHTESGTVCRCKTANENRLPEGKFTMTVNIPLYEGTMPNEGESTRQEAELPRFIQAESTFVRLPPCTCTDGLSHPSHTSRVATSVETVTDPSDPALTRIREAKLHLLQHRREQLLKHLQDQDASSSRSEPGTREPAFKRSRPEKLYAQQAFKDAKQAQQKMPTPQPQPSPQAMQSQANEPLIPAKVKPIAKPQKVHWLLHRMDEFLEPQDRNKVPATVSEVQSEEGDCNRTTASTPIHPSGETHASIPTNPSQRPESSCNIDASQSLASSTALPSTTSHHIATPHQRIRSACKPRQKRMMSETVQLERIRENPAALEAVARLILPAVRRECWELPDVDDVIAAVRETAADEAKAESVTDPERFPCNFAKPTQSSLRKRRCYCSGESAGSSCNQRPACRCSDKSTGNLCKGGPSLKVLQNLVVEMGWVPGCGFLHQRVRLGTSKAASSSGEDPAVAALRDEERMYHAWQKAISKVPEDAPINPTDPILSKFLDLVSTHGDVAAAAAALDARSELEAAQAYEKDLKNEEREIARLREEAKRQHQTWQATSRDLRRLEGLDAEFQNIAGHCARNCGQAAQEVCAQCCGGSTRWILASKQLQAAEARIRCYTYHSRLARLRAMRDERAARAKLLRAACALEARSAVREKLEQAARAQEARLEDAVRQLRAQITAKRMEMVVFACAMQWRAFVLRARFKHQKATRFAQQQLKRAAGYHWISLFRTLHGRKTREALTDIGLDVREQQADQFYRRRLTTSAWSVWCHEFTSRRPRLGRLIEKRKSLAQASPSDLSSSIEITLPPMVPNELATKSALKTLRGLAKKHPQYALQWIEVAGDIVSSRSRRHLTRHCITKWKWMLRMRRPHWMRLSISPAQKALTRDATSHSFDSYGFALTAWIYHTRHPQFTEMIARLRDGLDSTATPKKITDADTTLALVSTDSEALTFIGAYQVLYPQQLYQYLFSNVISDDNLSQEECAVLANGLKTYSELPSDVVRTLVSTNHRMWLTVDALARWHAWQATKPLQHRAHQARPAVSAACDLKLSSTQSTTSESDEYADEEFESEVPSPAATISKYEYKWSSSGEDYTCENENEDEDAYTHKEDSTDETDSEHPYNVHSRHDGIRELVADIWARRNALKKFYWMWRTAFKLRATFPAIRSQIYARAALKQMQTWAKVHRFQRVLQEKLNFERVSDAFAIWRFLLRQRRRRKQAALIAWSNVLNAHQTAQAKFEEFRRRRAQNAFSQWRDYAQLCLQRTALLDKIVTREEDKIKRVVLQQCKLDAKAYSVYRRVIAPTRVLGALTKWHDHAKLKALENRVCGPKGALAMHMLGFHFQRFRDAIQLKMRTRSLVSLADEFRSKHLMRSTLEPWLKWAMAIRTMRIRRLTSAFKVMRARILAWRDYAQNKLYSLQIKRMREALQRWHVGAHARATYIEHFHRVKSIIEAKQRTNTLRRLLLTWQTAAEESYHMQWEARDRLTRLAYAFRRFRASVSRRKHLRKWVFDAFLSARREAFQVWRKRTALTKALEIRADLFQERVKNTLLRCAFYAWDEAFKENQEKRSMAFRRWRTQIRRTRQERMAERLYRRSLLAPCLHMMRATLALRSHQARLADEFHESCFGPKALAVAALNTWREAYNERKLERAALVRADGFHREHILLPWAQSIIRHWKKRTDRTTDLRARGKAVSTIVDQALVRASFKNWRALLWRRETLRMLTENAREVRMANQRHQAFAIWREVAAESSRLRALESKGDVIERQFRIRRTLSALRRALSEALGEGRLDSIAHRHFKRQSLYKLRHATEESHSFRARFEAARITSATLRCREAVRFLIQNAHDRARYREQLSGAVEVDRKFTLRNAFHLWRAEFVAKIKRKQDTALLFRAWRSATLRKARLRTQSETFVQTIVHPRLLKEAWEAWRSQYLLTENHEARLKTIALQAYELSQKRRALHTLRRFSLLSKHHRAVHERRRTAAAQQYERKLLSDALRAWREAHYAKGLERAAESMLAWRRRQAIQHWRDRTMTTISKREVEMQLGGGIYKRSALAWWCSWVQERQREKVLQKHAIMQQKRFALRKLYVFFEENRAARQERMQHSIIASEFAAKGLLSAAWSTWRHALRNARILSQAERCADEWANLTLSRQALQHWKTLTVLRVSKRLEQQRLLMEHIETARAAKAAEESIKKCIMARFAAYGAPESTDAPDWLWSDFDDSEWRIEDEAMVDRSSAATHSYVVRFDPESTEFDASMPLARATEIGSAATHERPPVPRSSLEPADQASRILKPLYPALHRFRQLVVAYHGLGADPQRTIFLAWRAWTRIRRAHRQAHIMGMRARARDALLKWRDIVLRRAQREAITLRLEDSQVSPEVQPGLSASKVFPSVVELQDQELENDPFASNVVQVSESLATEELLSRPKKQATLRLTGPPLVREYLLANARDGAGYISLMTTGFAHQGEKEDLQSKPPLEDSNEQVYEFGIQLAPED